MPSVVLVIGLTWSACGAEAPHRGVTFGGLQTAARGRDVQFTARGNTVHDLGFGPYTLSRLGHPGCHVNADCRHAASSAAVAGSRWRTRRSPIGFDHFLFVIIFGKDPTEPN